MQYCQAGLLDGPLTLTIDKGRKDILDLAQDMKVPFLRYFQSNTIGNMLPNSGMATQTLGGALPAIAGKSSVKECD